MIHTNYSESKSHGMNYISCLSAISEKEKGFEQHFWCFQLFGVFQLFWSEFFIMPLMSLGRIIFGPILGLIQYLQSKGLLPNPKTCPACSTATTMVLECRDDVSDKYRWRCPTCQKGISLRDGTFFNKSHLSVQKWVILIHWWAMQYPVTDAAEKAEVTESTASQVYSGCERCVPLN